MPMHMHHGPPGPPPPGVPHPPAQQYAAPSRILAMNESVWIQLGTLVTPPAAAGDPATDRRR